MASLDAALREWLEQFATMAVSEQKSLIGRYRWPDVILRKLGELKETIEASLTEKSPLEQHPDAEESLRDRWQEELKAAVEAEYRRQRGELLLVVEWWLRDVWIWCLRSSGALNAARDAASETGLLSFPTLEGSAAVAARISVSEARENLAIMEQLQQWMGTNVQEALAMEVALLKLKL